MASADEVSKLSVSSSAQNNPSHFCNIPNFCSTSSSSPSQKLTGRKRPRASNNEICSEDEMTSLVAAELNKLTFQERETVYEEVHAIGATDYQNQISAEEMQRLINQTRQHISITRRNKQAYNRAAFLNPEYVDSDEFLSLFVIGEKFVPLNAAKKVIDHFAIKAELFAPHLLAKKITFQDLDEEDQRSLMTGSFQAVGTDLAGRTVILGTPCHEYKTVDNQLRAMWYIFMKTMEEHSTRKKGMVCVYFLSSTLANDNRSIDFYLKGSMVQKSIPFHVKGFHFCYDHEIFRPIMSALQLAIGNHMRLRFRSHYGSTVEINYSLQTFGISGSLFPIAKHGNLSLDKFRNYLATVIQQEREEELKNGGKILCPTSVDVLLGRGRHPQEHLGNLNLAELVDAHTGTYASMPSQDKRTLNCFIVQTVQGQGGRFLKRGPRGEGWEVVGDEVAIDKVRNRFREAISQDKQKHNTT
ncbi:unnamed protein product [Cylindrotheca closterium]|uniref:DUF6824 domain-containing protein n=1 Tax=Cylindrotheca closterium TaxID=2856 RepID=A0AAD2CLX5_9STRA|nr:unnamed protein product [Cylindrotheca closterium]